VSYDDEAKIGQLSEPGEYDAGMLALLQIIWGDGFLSPGGTDELARLFEGSDIGDCEVLDIGCGLGAIDEILVADYRARSVVGVDIDPGLLAGMQRRIESAGLADRIRGVRVDGGPLPFPPASFDVVFSKDSMVQIPDKPKMFAEILRVLRPGGRLIASDWLRGGTGEYSPEMMEFFHLEGIAYNMATLDESAAALRAAGFIDVEIRDRHDWYLRLAQRELDAMEGSLRPLIVGKIGAERAQHFIDDWRQLVIVLRRGELRPGHLRAVKPR
jgi:SAM-dependent methyltransferase